MGLLSSQSLILDLVGMTSEYKLSIGTSDGSECCIFRDVESCIRVWGWRRGHGRDDAGERLVRGPQLEFRSWSVALSGSREENRFAMM